MHKLHKPISLVIAASVSLGFATLSAGFSLAAMQPSTSKSEQISATPILLAQSVNQNEILEAHNKYREEVGVPPLEWSDSLASSAQKWADQLAAKGDLDHSSTNYGENLWSGSSGAFSQTRMVDRWGSEKQFFISGQPFPNACQGGICGHYTQIIWKNTTEVGCGLASGKGKDYLVCQYNPSGNFEGEMPY